MADDREPREERVTLFREGNAGFRKVSHAASVTALAKQRERRTTCAVRVNGGDLAQSNRADVK